MVDTLAGLLFRCYAEMKKAKREKWIRDWAGMLSLAAGQIAWTAECTKAPHRRGREARHGAWTASLHAVCCRVGAAPHGGGAQDGDAAGAQEADVAAQQALRHGSGQPWLARPQEGRQHAGRLEAWTAARHASSCEQVVNILTVEVHSREVLDKMVKAGCASVNDFEWLLQLRFYWEAGTERCVVRQTNTCHKFGYEYIGNPGRLVITPLTDRCYTTLTTARRLHRACSGHEPRCSRTHKVRLGAAPAPRRASPGPGWHGQDGDGQGPLQEPRQELHRLQLLRRRRQEARP